ncbi:hypothetical protein TNCV_2084951 [Trichonephila clavipes]|uniref:Uncharacterized protein n=1 Tax=Trichonephila clavipes TaxID=2585209 RepID=A0A8X6RJU6_TRICX|nr:hypothetical protein TNCV_2084951 [Trichonephila clavipes]
MLTIFWDASGVFYTEFLTKKLTVNSDRAVLYNNRIIQATHPQIRPETSVFLLCKTRCKTTLQCTQYIMRKLKFTVVPQPSYNSDLAVWLFLNLKETLKGQRFSTDADVQAAERKWIRCQPESFSMDELMEWIKQLYKCLSVSGDYVGSYKMSLQCIIFLTRFCKLHLNVTESLNSTFIHFKRQKYAFPVPWRYQWRNVHPRNSHIAGIGRILGDQNVMVLQYSVTFDLGPKKPDFAGGPNILRYATAKTANTLQLPDLIRDAKRQLLTPISHLTYRYADNFCSQHCPSTTGLLMKDGRHVGHSLKKNIIDC